MKKFILLVLVVLSSTIHLSAQTYKINKLNYDYRFYTPKINDPYNPGICAVASFIMPGLGQIIAGETARGLAFLGGCSGFLLLASSSMLTMPLEAWINGIEYPYVSSSVMLISTLGYIAIDIWSIADAVKVAEVNNMYIQHIRKNNGESYIESIQLTPFIDRLSINNQVVTPVGLKLSVTF